MARIGIDATSVGPLGKGIARVQRRSVEALARASHAHELVAFVREPAAAALLSASGVETVVRPHRLMLQWEQVGLPRAFAAHRLDVLLTFTERLPLAGRGRYVVWLYELPARRIEANRERGAGAHQRAADLLTQLLWRRSLLRAARVLAGSGATALEIEAALPELGGGVRAVYAGLDAEFSPGRGRGGERYVLHIGSDDPRDNTETAIDAFARVRSAQPVRLVIAGSLGRRAGSVEAAAERAGVRGRTELLGRVSDEALVELYRGAAAYLDPTLYEGFGFQVLEAMACGAPVVASSTTSIPELAAGAALLCDPRSADDLAAALMRVLDEPAVAEGLRAAGVERAREFTWDRTASALLEVLEEAAAP